VLFGSEKKREKYTIYGKVQESPASAPSTKEKRKNRDKYTIYGKVVNGSSAAAPTSEEHKQTRTEKRTKPKSIARIESSSVERYRANRVLPQKTKRRKRRAVRRAFRTIFGAVRGNTLNLLFEEIDRDGDGKLSKKDIAASAKLMRMCNREAELRFLEDLQDINGDGYISKEEFDRAVQWISSSAPNEIPDAILEKIEFDNDGVLTRERLFSDSSELIEAFDLLDANHDGSIDIDDLDRATLTSKGVDGESIEEIEETLAQLEPLERQSFRLDGFDPYILVSVLTAGTSFDVIKGYNVKWDTTVAKSTLAQVTQEDWFMMVLLNTGAASTLCGAYAFVTFSLTVLYGKTALGLDKDDAYFEFLDSTGLQRYRAFQAFSASLSLFCVLVFLELFQKTPGVFRIPIGIVFLVFLYFGRKEYDYIIESAGPIFAPKAATTTTPEDDEEGE
jgi:Ca2+-binding EF-hand superfamily protein